MQLSWEREVSLASTALFTVLRRSGERRATATGSTTCHDSHVSFCRAVESLRRLTQDLLDKLPDDCEKGPLQDVHKEPGLQAAAKQPKEAVLINDALGSLDVSQLRVC
eukprot:UN4058